MAKFWIQANLDEHPSHQRKIQLTLMKLFAFQSEFFPSPLVPEPNFSPPVGSGLSLTSHANILLF